jgi:hypothetical protein
MHESHASLSTSDEYIFIIITSETASSCAD